MRGHHIQEQKRVPRGEHDKLVSIGEETRASRTRRLRCVFTWFRSMPIGQFWVLDPLGAFLVSPIFDKFLLDYGRISCLQRSQASSPLSATATSRKFEFGLSRCPQFSNLPLGPQQPPKWLQPHQPILDLPYALLAGSPSFSRSLLIRL